MDPAIHNFLFLRGPYPDNLNFKVKCKASEGMIPINEFIDIKGKTAPKRLSLLLDSFYQALL